MTAPPGPPPPQQENLPPGWKLHWSSVYSTSYYVNIYTEESTWVLPTEPALDPTRPMQSFQNEAPRLQYQQQQNLSHVEHTPQSQTQPLAQHLESQVNQGEHFYNPAQAPPAAQQQQNPPHVEYTPQLQTQPWAEHYNPAQAIPPSQQPQFNQIQSLPQPQQPTVRYQQQVNQGGYFPQQHQAQPQIRHQQNSQEGSFPQPYETQRPFQSHQVSQEANYPQAYETRLPIQPQQNSQETIFQQHQAQPPQINQAEYWRPPTQTHPPNEIPQQKPDASLYTAPPPGQYENQTVSPTQQATTPQYFPYPPGKTSSETISPAPQTTTGQYFPPPPPYLPDGSSSEHLDFKPPLPLPLQQQQQYPSQGPPTTPTQPAASGQRMHNMMEQAGQFGTQMSAHTRAFGTKIGNKVGFGPSATPSGNQPPANNQELTNATGIHNSADASHPGKDHKDWKDRTDEEKKASYKKWGKRAAIGVGAVAAVVVGVEVIDAVSNLGDASDAVGSFGGAGDAASNAASNASIMASANAASLASAIACQDAGNF
ncbi:hypothetical protein G7Y89_g10244 [Cudoniella acicularis]|uniref:WW domain-containing protein n=1 Tax=Cudoniella acicularis TaxID=354080 RepID=A0A8H4RFF4_9HELO|nr:hypothetical protein G7Y89_g10244 [Cudoniella acicularis]